MAKALAAAPGEGRLIRTCSIWRALEVVGDAPTMLILESFWFGDRRFDAFQKRTGLLKALLSDRLKRLVEHGILEKRQYCERPVRYEYWLTEKGLGLYWVSLAMLRWERRWGEREGKIRIRLDHRTCGAKDIEPVPGCTECGEEFTARDIDWKPGPGAGWMAPSYSRRRRQRAPSDGPISQTTLLDEIVQVTGDRWASLILRSVFTGFRRYDEIQKDTAMATNILAERLQWLTDIKMLSRQTYTDSPTRYEYRLTERGIGYYPVLVMLMLWGDAWYRAPEGPPLRLYHGQGGHELQPAILCSHCSQPIRPVDTDFELYEVPSRAAPA